MRSMWCLPSHPPSHRSEGVATILIVALGARHSAPRDYAHRWHIVSPQCPPSSQVRGAPTADSKSNTTRYTPSCGTNCQAQSYRVMASPSGELPTPEATLVSYRPGACRHVRAMAILAGVIPASVAMMAPLIVAVAAGHGTRLLVPYAAASTWVLLWEPGGGITLRGPRNTPTRVSSGWSPAPTAAILGRGRLCRGVPCCGPSGTCGSSTGPGT